VKRTQIALAVVALSFGGLFLWRSRSASPPHPTTEESATGGFQVGQPTPQGSAPKLDIVFALDTTGSMGGLIDGAKAKIWEVARRAQQGQPAPQLRVGLVAYRDVGDEYVTRVVELSPDMDAIYAALTELSANGGGDTPEHVLKGLHDAVDVEHWSDDPEAIKLVYLVGDAPPHLDYHDGLTLDGVLGDAVRKGIRISAIRCGNDPATLAAWTNIAERTDPVRRRPCSSQRRALKDGDPLRKRRRAPRRGRRRGQEPRGAHGGAGRPRVVLQLSVLREDGSEEKGSCGREAWRHGDRKRGPGRLAGRDAGHVAR
jgi:hypothetical protein